MKRSVGDDARLTAKERRIMDILFADEKLTVGEVQGRLDDDSTYSSVRASLNRLLDKGQLEAVRAGAKYVYSPAQDRDAVSRGALQKVMSTFFQGSRVETIQAVLQFGGDDLDEGELAAIKSLIAAAERGERND